MVRPSPRPVFVAGVRLESGEVMISITQPGGGYGPPTEREPERVQKDLAEGWITNARARDTYGVVVGVDGMIDVAATHAKRKELTAH
jgi:N-methylhydantoinase B